MISEESNTAPAVLEQDPAADNRNGDDLDGHDFAVLLGEDPRHVGTAHPQVPADSLPQVQGQDLEEEVPDGGGTPLPGLLKDAHREILRLRRKLHRSKDQKAELQREIDRLRHRLQEKE